MEDWKTKLDSALPQIKSHLEALLSAQATPLGAADPPEKPGVYIVYDHLGKLAYVGEAKGSGGLRDRLLGKHLSGDDNHAIQRAYRDAWPDRKQRREFIKTNIRVCWIETADANMASALERVAILVFDPPWNRR